MEQEHKSLSDQTTPSSGMNHEYARSNLARLSEMLEAQETTEKLKATGVKGMIAATATATASVMGITGNRITYMPKFDRHHVQKKVIRGTSNLCKTSKS